MTAETFMYAFSLCLLHSLWQAAALALMAKGVLTFSVGLPGAVRYRLLTAIALIFLTLVGCTFAYYLPSDNTPLELSGRSGSGMTAFATPTFSVTEWTLRYADTIVWVWSLICCAKCAWLLYSFNGLRRLRTCGTMVAEEWTQRLFMLSERIGLTVKVQLKESLTVTQPMVFGVLRPLILVPAGMFLQLAPQEAEAVLLHELAHIRRRDYLYNIFQYCAEIVFFFNPGVYWLSAMIRRERECCCDDIVLAAGTDRSQYIRGLISFEDTNTGAMALYATRGLNPLPARVYRMLHGKRKKAGYLTRIGVFVGMLSGMLLLVVALSSMAQQPMGIRRAPVKDIVMDTIPQGESQAFIDGFRAGRAYRLAMTGEKESSRTSDGSRALQGEQKRALEQWLQHEQRRKTK